MLRRASRRITDPPICNRNGVLWHLREQWNVRFGSRADASIVGRVLWHRLRTLSARSGHQSQEQERSRSRNTGTRLWAPSGQLDARFSSSTLAVLLQDDYRLAASVYRAASCQNSASATAIRHSRLSAWIWIDETPETKEWLDQTSSSSAIEPLKSHPRPVD